MHSSAWIFGLLIVAVAAALTPIARALRARRDPNLAPSREVSIRRATLAFSLTALAVFLPVIVIGAAVLAWILFAN